MLALLIYSFFVLITAAAAVILSRLLGKPAHNPHKDVPYESGMVPTGEAHVRTAMPYYLVGIFFMMFDLDVLFLYPWAVRLYELSWPGFLKVIAFLFFAVAGLAYIWFRGGLAWRRLSRTASETRTYSQD